MISPTSPGYEIWYQANLTCYHNCLQWNAEIEKLKKQFDQVGGQEQITQMSQKSKTELAGYLKNRGAKARSFARTATKVALVDWIIRDKLDSIHQEVERLTKLIEDNRPAPMWREKKEE